jgi:hypothetical protein
MGYFEGMQSSTPRTAQATSQAVAPRNINDDRVLSPVVTWGKLVEVAHCMELWRHLPVLART